MIKGGEAILAVHCLLCFVSALLYPCSNTARFPGRPLELHHTYPVLSIALHININLRTETQVPLYRRYLHCTDTRTERMRCYRIPRRSDTNHISGTRQT